ncbi:hypothetical protein CRG98_038918 [Punica granatum]|uniref:Uncharacterized protein n=1 Tax=Punica granatum TaxID=22663 RepID=A0A2I0IA27_PUNGR|nr:hypothetical protein CRG98_038918 [Punica granatum]
MGDCNRGAGDSYFVSQEQLEDHARAFFDSADWALCKQGAGLNQETVALETLRPKLERTPHQRLPPRRPACTSGRDRLISHVDRAE